MPAHISNTRRITLMVSGVALAAGIAAAAILGLRYHQYAPLGRLLAERLAHSGARDVAVDSAAISPLRGIRSARIAAVWDSGDDIALRLESGPLTLACRPWPLLKTLWRARNSAGETATTYDSAWIRKTIVSATLEHVHLRATLPELGDIDAFGRLSCSTTAPHALLYATLFIDSIARDTLLLCRDLSAAIALNPGVLRIERVSATLLEGSIAGQAVLRPGAVFDSISCVARNLSLQALMTLLSHNGLSGAGRLSLDCALASTPSGISGYATARGDSVRVSGGELLSTLSGLFGAPLLHGAQFDSITAGLSVNPATVTIDSLQGAGPLIRFRSSGWIAYDGRLRQEVAGTFSRVFMNSLSPVARKSLIPGPGGSGRFAFTVQGSTRQAVVSLDKALLDRAVSTIAEAIQEELLRGLR